VKAPDRIVVLIGDEEIQHRFVASHLADLGNTTIVIARQPKAPIRNKLATSIRRFGLAGAISRALLKIALRIGGETSRRQADLSRVLGDPQFPDSVPVYKTIGVNSVETQTLLRQLAPDILCVYGTYIVSDSTLSICPIALNLHTGISPRYRGADCYFWPLYEGEPDFVGATVHQCTSDVDGGDIYRVAQAELRSGDGLGAIFGRSVLTGSSLYRSVVQDFISKRDVNVISQDLSEGQEYKAAMRGWLAEFRVMRFIRGGLSENP
jgi:methionyl-tRNA formyltransferase